MPDVKYWVHRCPNVRQMRSRRNKKPSLSPGLRRWLWDLAPEWHPSTVVMGEQASTTTSVCITIWLLSRSFNCELWNNPICIPSVQTCHRALCQIPVPERILSSVYTALISNVNGTMIPHWHNHQVFKCKHNLLYPPVGVHGWWNLRQRFNLPTDWILDTSSHILGEGSTICPLRLSLEKGQHTLKFLRPAFRPP